MVQFLAMSGRIEVLVQTLKADELAIAEIALIITAIERGACGDSLNIRVRVRQ